jgi:hypothetical protein
MSITPPKVFPSPAVASARFPEARPPTSLGAVAQQAGLLLRTRRK